MKPIFLFSLIFLISCISEPDKRTDTIGEERRFEPLMVTVEDSERILAICRALSSKEDLLNVLVTTGAEYSFNYTEKNCDQAEASASKNVIAVISRSESGYVFKTKKGEAFGFSDVETFSKGVMSELCQMSGSFMSPVQTSRTGALWFTTFTSSEYCQSDSNGICIHLQRGTFVGNNNYKIHSNEWIKFKITNDKRGFFTERKLISTASCSKGIIERKAVLR
jgi:hypothetical protein